ncbi:zinc knuckle domain-containing protein [Cyclospora cayetanensis]|uniref:Branchpoint-bridging protein n=1 Tax=Cyclospora cayetanensis TaxID=88456 RepID=A0A1D3CV32_9EIME|nr:zinc knuckle domain-containing protein [Cyclospora cayetanensis]
MEQLMALVPLEAALTHKEKGRKSRWEKSKKSADGSRWGSENDKPFLPPPFVDLPIGMTPLQVDRFLREQRIDELYRKLNAGILEFFDADIRPPSPPPIYDKNGGRVNTRDVRYPDYNFMGIIIGPRGCNHKRLEAESGCTISVRGRGTQKEGKRDHQTDEEASMPMHVHIIGDTDEAVERAVALIEPLLDPLHPAHEEFKRRGLEQLALVNGVNYSDLDQRRCAICQALGHSGENVVSALFSALVCVVAELRAAHECPDNQDLQPFKKPQVRCAICGDLGHVTMDCKMRRPDGSGAPGGPPGGCPPPPPPIGGRQRPPHRSGADYHKMDMEYRRMMDELTGEKSDLGALDAPRPPPGPGGPQRTPVGASPASQMYTPPPGMSPAGADGYPPSPYAGRPPPPPAVVGSGRMGGPSNMMPVGPGGAARGPWGGPAGGAMPMGGGMPWAGNHMRPPMMPMGAPPVGMPWPMQPMMPFPPAQQHFGGDGGMSMMGMWGGPMAPSMGYTPTSNGGQWQQQMPQGTGVPMGNHQSAPGVPPGGPPGGPMPPSIPPPSAPSMPPPPMPAGSASADPDSMEFGD